MHKARTLTVTALIAVFLLSAPGARAQSPDDLRMMQTFLSIMQDYFAIINATHGVTSDPEKAAIMQMQKIQEVYEERGEKAKSIQVLLGVLDTSRNPAIRNAVYIMVGDTLKETGRADEAIKLLQRGLQENVERAQ